MSTSGLLLLRKKNEHAAIDLILIIGSLVFALMTLSRAAIVCMLMIIALYVFGGENRGLKRAIGILSMFAAVTIVGVLVYVYIPAIFENLLERFRRKDVWNGRVSLLTQYMKFIFMSPVHLMFGIGMQGIFDKVSSVIWVHDVPHNGLQEALVAWGVPGLIAMIAWLGMIVKISKAYSGRKRDFYQFVPLLLTVVFTMVGQFLTSSRALMALAFAYICLCIGGNTDKKDARES